MDKRFKLKMITMPMFITMEMPPRPRQEGIKSLPTIAIEELSPEEAAEYAEWMRVSFLEHWKERKQRPA